MRCFKSGSECVGKVLRREADGLSACWLHWTDDLPEVPAAAAVASASRDREAKARALIREDIHRRDGIVLGRDPLGNLCGCGCNDPLPGSGSDLAANGLEWEKS